MSISQINKLAHLRIVVVGRIAVSLSLALLHMHRAVVRGVATHRVSVPRHA